MARSGRRAPLVAAVTALALLAAPLPALADFAINIVGPGAYGGAGLTVFDNGPGDLDPSPGVILIMAGAGGLPTIPGLSLNIDIGQSNSPGGPSFSLVDLGWTLSSFGSGGGTIQVTASATDFAMPESGVLSTLNSAVGGTLTGGGGGSVTAQQWANLSNLLFGLGPITPGAQGPFITTAFSNLATTGFTSNASYSITDRVILTLGPGASTTGDLQSTVVPEPITMFLGGTGLLVLGYAARRRLFGR